MHKCIEQKTAYYYCYLFLSAAPASPLAVSYAFHYILTVFGIVEYNIPVWTLRVTSEDSRNADKAAKLG
jgi:hypothetical protein